MNDDWRSRNTMTVRDGAKAGCIVFTLLLAAVIALIVFIRTRQKPAPPQPAPTQQPAK